MGLAIGRSVGVMVGRLTGVLMTGITLALFGCSAGGPGVSPRTASHEPAGPRTASNELAAQGDAARLLGAIVLPSGASQLARAPRGSGNLLSSPGFRPGVVDLVDRHSFWRVRAPLASVVAFLRRHKPSGAQPPRWSAGPATGPHIPPNQQVAFGFRALGGRISTRLLNITAVALPRGWTGLRVDAEDVWIVTRPVGEKVPSGVHEVDITSAFPPHPPRMAVSVVDPAQVREIIGWIDAMPVVQPAAYSCPMLGNGPIVTLDFRTRSRALLARASVLDFEGISGPCNAVHLSIGGQPKTPLIGGSFLRKLQRLLNLHFS